MVANRLRPRLRAIAGWISSFGLCASAAAPIRFYASPYKVFEGDAVIFHLMETDGVTVASISSWSWDFNGDGVVDASGTTGTTIDATWYATFDGTKADHGVQLVRPVLWLTYTNAETGTVVSTNQVGVTEDVVGFDKQADPDIFVLERGAGNADIQVAVSANPRLVASSHPVVRFYAQTTLLKPGSVESTNILWHFGDGSTNRGSNPDHTYAPTEALYTVDVAVTYSIIGPPAYTNTVVRTNLGFVRVVTTPKELELGRAYRRGFPQEYDWDDIIQAYGAVGYDEQGHEDRYVYLHHLETAYNGLLEPMRTNSANPENRRRMAEILNEIAQGQSLVGNQRLIEALRSKYPRLASSSAETNDTERLPVPPGVREETAAIDVALLDYQAALVYPFQAIREFGSDILRTRALEGKEPFPDFPRYITFLDPTLSQQPVPIKNEYWQLTSLLDRLAQGTVEKAKKLFRLSIQEPLAREEAKEECKRAGLQGYLGMAVLAAGQTPQDFAANEGNSLLAHVKNARDLFESINAGLNPLGNDGSFVPNESFGAIHQDAQEAVADAREAEIRAREEDRTYDRYQADLRNEQQSQRAAFITPLRNLTGLDPALYNNLQTVDDQVDYRTTIRQRVDALAAAYPNSDPKGLGEYGAQVIAILDAQEAIIQAVNRMQNLYEAIQISEWANAEIELANDQATQQFRANDIALGYADAFTGSIAWTHTFGTHGGNEFGVTLRFDTAALVKGYLNADDRDIQRLQSAKIASVQLQEQVRKSLLDVANLAIDIRRAKNRLDQEILKLDSMLSLMDRYIEDLAHARDTAANLYFQDPSFRVVVSRAQRRAEGELDFAIDRLYRLAKTLEYEWTEPYRNPVIVPVHSQEAPSLENPLFDKFTELDSLFIVRTADESKDYLDALKAWDSKLRRINIISVRGPNHAGPITAEPISLRELAYGFLTTGPNAVTLDRSIRQFRDYIGQHRVASFFNTANPTLQLEFSTGIADNSYFPSTGSRWNMRIHGVSVEVYADYGFSPKQVAEADLYETGMVSLRRFWAEPGADDLFHLTFNLGRPERSVYGIVVPARINGATGQRPASEFTSLGLQGRPIAATRWILRIDTDNPSNADIDFTKLKDIVLRFTYTYGNPPEFPGF